MNPFDPSFPPGFMPDVRFDPLTGAIPDVPCVERRLSDLRGYFADEAAFAAALAVGDPVLYRVASVEAAQGEGQLHYGVGVIEPGRVGQEYYMTKGHLHAFRPAAELYVGIRGRGVMLLEEEGSGASRLVPLEPHGLVYVPGHTAHRTVNTGDEPLVYLGVYPAQAGHDYAFVQARNFSCVVVERDGQPAMEDRRRYLASRSTLPR